MDEFLFNWMDARSLWVLLVIIGACLAVLGLAVGLVLSAFEDSLVFFYSPTDLKTRQIATDRPFRLGGLVEEGSVRREGATTHFRVTDLHFATQGQIGPEFLGSYLYL